MPGSCRREGLVDQFAQRGPHAVEPLALGQLADIGARDDDDVVPGRHTRPFGGERLTQQSLDGVARDGAPDLARNRQPKARVAARLARERVDDEVAVALRSSLAIDALELRAARQAPALGAARGRGDVVGIADG
jgi:hypothetical protein